MSTAEHFDLEAWIDFVRGLVSADREAEMRAHLETGCPSCTELHEDLQRISRIATRDTRYEPPETMVRLAKAVFKLRKPPRGKARMSSAVSLLFDSRLAAAPVGLRNGATGSRRLVVASEGLIVDLQVPAAHESKVLVGQVKAHAPNTSVQGLHLRLHNRRMHVVARTATNRLGEFQMEFESVPDPLALVIWSDDYARVIQVIPLGAL